MSSTATMEKPEHVKSSRPNQMMSEPSAPRVLPFPPPSALSGPLPSAACLLVLVACSAGKQIRWQVGEAMQLSKNQACSRLVFTTVSAKASMCSPTVIWCSVLRRVRRSSVWPPPPLSRFAAEESTPMKVLIRLVMRVLMLMLMRISAPMWSPCKDVRLLVLCPLCELVRIFVLMRLFLLVSPPLGSAVSKILSSSAAAAPPPMMPSAMSFMLTFPATTAAPKSMMVTRLASRLSMAASRQPRDHNP
mmetsp:Transcript_46221/g.148409  ORF Transcript_46221/g.148409 Transcript_46221/m.148409 type:complete len:247 (+) Transcript_46221:2346-3086(+)